MRAYSAVIECHPAYVAIDAKMSFGGKLGLTADFYMCIIYRELWLFILRRIRDMTGGTKSRERGMLKSVCASLIVHCCRV